jgi:hypothetical protein
MATVRAICSIGARGATTLVRTTGGWQAGTPPQPRHRCAVVTDLIDESFLPLDVPALGRADRQGFVDLQLRNRFPDTPLRTTLPYRSKSNPGRIMLTGVANAQAELAIQELADSPAELVGVWSLPTLLMGALAKHLRKLPPAFLTMLPTPNGLRLLVVLDGQLVLTRLLPLQNPGRQNQDVVATQRYLEDGRLIPRGSPLALLPLDCPADQVQALAETGFKVIASPWRPKRGASEHDRLLDLAFQSPPGQLGTLRLRERYRLHVVRRAMVAGTGAGICMAAMGALQMGQQSYDTWYRIDEARQSAEGFKRQAARTREEFQLLGVDSDALLIARKVQAEALGPGPEILPALQQVARVVADLPDWKLDRKSVV